MNPISTHRLTLALLGGSLMALTACSSMAPVNSAAGSGAAVTAASTASSPSPSIQASWVVLGENGQAVARVITSAASCPQIQQDGVLQGMQLRAPAETIAQRKTASSPTESKASIFPVLTCEASLKPGVRQLSVDGQSLPVPVAEVKKILVIGDTGCRMKLADNYFQSCNDSEKWAFREMIEAAARQHPDLVIHVGDYHYRENACPPGNPACANSPWGYGWDTWKADFFDPARSLLKTSPWVMVRGNHETCTRAGQGWWRFLDPRPLQSGRDCNVESNDMLGNFSAPYAVPVGSAGGQTAQLIVFDSSREPNKPLAKDDPAYLTYLDEFAQVDKLATTADMNFFLDHHPVLGFGVDKKGDELQTWPGNLAMQDEMKVLHPTRLFPQNVQATISGHVHLFEALTFREDLPVQFVSGNGGSSLDTPLPVPLKAGSTPYSAAHLEFFSNSNEVGFMTMEREGDIWQIKGWNLHGKLLTACTMKNGKTECRSML